MRYIHLLQGSPPFYVLHHIQEIAWLLHWQEPKSTLQIEDFIVFYLQDNEYAFRIAAEGDYVAICEELLENHDVKVDALDEVMLNVKFDVWFESWIANLITFMYVFFFLQKEKLNVSVAGRKYFCSLIINCFVSSVTHKHAKSKQKPNH